MKPVVGNDESKFLDVSVSLLESLSNAEGLQGLADVGFKIFNNPIIISNHSWTALAMTGNIDIPDDEGWNEFLSKGTLSIKTVSQNIQDSLAERIENSEEPFIWESAEMNNRRLLGKVAVRKRPVGTVSVIEYYREFNENDITIMSLFASAVSAEMQKSGYLHFTRSLLYEDFIIDILADRIRGSVIIQEKIRLIKLALKENIRVFVIDIAEFDDKNLSISYIRDYFERLLSGSMAVVYSDRIITIKSYSSEGSQFESDISNLNAFLRKYDIRCGISRSFPSLELLRDHYKQALSALRVGMHVAHDSYVYEYDDYVVYHIADLCANQTDIKSLSHTSLRHLLEYDRTHKTFFAQSLYGYLKANRNITDAAEELHLHRNTLIYHLKRAEEIMTVDLDDSHILQHIELSFRFLEYENGGILQ